MSSRWLYLVFLTLGAGCNNSTPGNNPGDSAGDPAGDSLTGDTNPGDTAMGDTAMGDTAMGDTVMGDTAMGDPAMGDPAMGDPAMGDPAMGDTFMGCGPAPTPGTVIYVDGGVADGGDGTSWVMAYNDLQDALAVATSGQAIWVAAGTYYPVVPASPPTVSGAERQEDFALVSGVVLLGGFLPGDVAECDRDWTTNLTILSGDLLDDNVDSDADDIIDMGLADNSYHIVRASSPGPGTRIDGFTIEGAYASGGTTPSNFGGGILQQGGELEVANVRVLHNNNSNFGGGAGYAVLGGVATVTDSIFEANFSDYSGGSGFYSDDNAQAVLRRVTFTRNRAEGEGAGMTVDGSDWVWVEDSLFDDNHIVDNSGGNGNGGGLSLRGDGTLIVTRTHFTNNTAESIAGALYNYFGDLRVSHCVFAQNNAESGGAFGQVTGARSSFSYSVITGNSATNGGALYSRSYLRLDHVTVAGNTASSNGGALWVNLSGGSEGPVRFSNSIIWGNTAGGVDGVFTPGTFGVSNSILQESVGSPWYGTDTFRGRDGGGVLDTDPLFVNMNDAAGLDGIYGTSDDGLRLQDASPAIDIGVPNDVVDLDGDEDYREQTQDLADADGDNDFDEEVPFDLTEAPRSHSRTVDLGAYENQTVTPATPALIYVDAAAAPAGDGTTWGTAYDTLVEALGVARFGDEIWVAQGAYIPGIDRDDTFLIPAGVGIYGGFTGIETMRSDREADPLINGTTLSGAIDSGDDDDNIRHVVNASAMVPAGTLDGFTISDGYEVLGGGNGNGAGLYMFMGSPTLQNLRFTNNETGGTGGAVYIASRSHPHLRHVTFSGNIANGTAGGGVYTEDSHTVISDFYFTGNSAGGGGGIANVSSIFSGNPNAQLWLSHGVFYQNDGSDNLSTPGPSGGGVMGLSLRSKTYMTNVLFALNHSVNGGAFGAFNNAEMHASYVTLYGNTATRGGGISAYNSSQVYLTNAIVWGNTDTDSGDQVYASTSLTFGGDVTIQHTDMSFLAGDVFICGTCSVVDAGNNITMDPLFVATGDLDGADNIFGTPDDGLNLSMNSPARDVGTSVDLYDIDADGDMADTIADITDRDMDDDFDEAVTEDVAGNPRVTNTIPDMGAFEYSP